MKKQTLWAMPAALSIRAAMTTASALAMSADGAAEVRTGVEAAFPGLRMDFLAGERDLSSYGSVVVSVSNTTYLRVHGRAEARPSPYTFVWNQKMRDVFQQIERDAQNQTGRDVLLRVHGRAEARPSPAQPRFAILDMT